MNLDDIQLMAYVDGTLPQHDHDAVEREASVSPDVANRVAMLRASQLPYGEAFAQQKLPPVPAGLTARIEEMARVAKVPAARPDIGANLGRDASANDVLTPHPPGSPVSSTIWSRLRVAPAWLSVAFLAGAFVCGLVLRQGSVAGPATSLVASVASLRAGVSPWVTAAASYQQLYSRETLADVDADPDLSTKTTAQIRQDDGLALRIPDLRAVGLTFKRVQRLRFNNKPLVQIVYLPEKGAPIALCVMKEAKPDAAVSSQQVASMTVVTWRQSELGYALIGQPDGVDLTALGKQISTSQAAPLYGSSTPPDSLASISHPIMLASAQSS